MTRALLYPLQSAGGRNVTLRDLDIVDPARDVTVEGWDSPHAGLHATSNVVGCIISGIRGKPVGRTHISKCDPPGARTVNKRRGCSGTAT